MEECVCTLQAWKSVSAPLDFTKNDYSHLFLMFLKITFIFKPCF